MTPLEHTIIATVIVAASFYTGRWVGTTVGIAKTLAWLEGKGLVKMADVEKEANERS